MSRNMTKKQKLRNGFCPKCGGNIKKVSVEHPNTLWLHKMVCDCGHVVMGRGVPNNIKNPFYFSERSYKFRTYLLEKLGYRCYADYLKSIHWKHLVAKYRMPCIVCGKKGQLHHRSYKKLGRETKSDFASLCQDHHFWAHYVHNK